MNPTILPPAKTQVWQPVKKMEFKPVRAIPTPKHYTTYRNSTPNKPGYMLSLLPCLISLPFWNQGKVMLKNKLFFMGKKTNNKN